MLLKSCVTFGKLTIEFGRINVLVGNNNAGKSTCLRDLFRLVTNREPSSGERDLLTAQPAQLLADIQLIAGLDSNSLLRGLTVDQGPRDDVYQIQGLGALQNAPHQATLRKDSWRILNRPALLGEALRQSELSNLMPLRLVYSQAEERHRLVQAVSACSPTVAPNSLLQVLQSAPADIHDAFSSAMASAFEGWQVQLDASERIQLCLRVAERFPPLPTDPREQVRYFRGFRSMEEQGSGFAHYAAVVLTVLLNPGRLLLLEQPEAQLHSTQARRLGNWIGLNAERAGGQVIAATHSPHFLAGAIEAHSDTRVIRWHRFDNHSRPQVIPATTSVAIASAPQLAGQRALEMLFHDGVILTRTDADRLVYEAAGANLGSQVQASFLQCRGRSAMARVLSLLRAVEYPSCVVSDLGVLASANAFAELVTVATGQPAPRGWLRTRQNLAQWVEAKFQDRDSANSSQAMEDFLMQLKRGDADPTTEASNVPRQVKAERWVRLNQEGIGVLPREMRLWVEEMLTELKRCGVFISPRGDVTGWMDLSTPKDFRDDWLVEALSKITSGQIPTELKVFLADAFEYLKLAASTPRAAGLGYGT